MRPYAAIKAVPGSSYTTLDDDIKVYLDICETKLTSDNLHVAWLADDSWNTYTVSSCGANNTAGKNKGSVTIIGAGLYGGSATFKFTIQSKNVYNKLTDSEKMAGISRYFLLMIYCINR